MAEQAVVLEELAGSVYAVDRLDDAFPAIERAIASYRELGDDGGGRPLHAGARRDYHWYAGDGDAARRWAAEAIEILEPLGESVELARAYSELSQLAMLVRERGAGARVGHAGPRARRRGSAKSSIRAHALINIGTVEAPDGLSARPATLLEAHAIADAAGDRHEATRALDQPRLHADVLGAAGARRSGTAQQALAYAREHEVHTLASYTATTIAWLRLRAGEWDEAERVTRGEIERGITVPQLLAKTVLAELAVRRGDPDALRAAGRPRRPGRPHRRAPAHRAGPRAGGRVGADERRADADRAVRAASSTSFARGRQPDRLGRDAGRRVGGRRRDRGRRSTEPLSPPLRGHAPAATGWAAADAFGDVGWTYDRALMLSLLDDEESLVEAIEIAAELGAEPLTRRVAGRMRELGLRVPQGPREARRARTRPA